MKAGVDYIGVGCGALIINEENKTLLIKRTENAKNEAGYWSKPGGSVEYGETIEAAIIREVKEELGVDVELLDFLGFTDHILSKENQHWIAFNYSAKIINGTPKNMEPDKFDELEWFSFDEMPGKLTQTTIESIGEYLKKGETYVNESQ